MAKKILAMCAGAAGLMFLLLAAAVADRVAHPQLSIHDACQQAWPDAVQTCEANLLMQDNARMIAERNRRAADLAGVN